MISEKLLKYMFSFCLSILLTLLSETSFAQHQAKYLYYIGGGEPVSQNEKATNFDYSFSYVRSLEKNNWKARYLFAGDQLKSKKLREAVAARSQTLTKENLIPFLQDIETNLATGRINHGQLMIYLDTHGVMENGKYTISTINGTADILPSLLKIRNLAKQNKVKLGIIGATCFSGQLMTLEDENTCVVTTAPADTVGLMMNNNVIAYLLGHNSAKNLEDLHLKSRKYKDIDLGQPLISTPAGKKAYEVLKELRTTVLVAGKKSGPEIYSVDQAGVEKTLANISALASISTSGKAATDEAPLISEQMISKLKSLDENLKSLLGKHRESLVTMLTNNCHSLNPDLKESVPCDLSRTEVSERNTSTTEETGIVVKSIELAADPANALNSNSNSNQNSLETLNQLVITSTQIGTIERDLYDLLYKKFSQETSHGHICQNFVTE